MVTPETAVRLMRLHMESRPVKVSEPGEVIEDVDGVPSYIGPSEEYETEFPAPILSLAEWKATAFYLLEKLDAANERNTR